jgi:two-component sensor histidine kinase
LNSQKIKKDIQFQSDIQKYETIIRLATEKLNSIFWIADTDLRLIFSKGFPLHSEKLNPNAIEGMSLYEYFQTDGSNHPMIEAHQRALEGHHLDIETLFDGAAYACHLAPLENGHSGITGVVGLARDITQNKQTDAELKNHFKEQNILLKVSQSVSSSLDLQNVLQVISDGTATLLNIETAAIYLLDGHSLYMGATTPPLDPNIPDSFRTASVKDHPHIEKTITDGQPHIIRDTRKAQLSEAEKNIVEIRKLRSLIFLPFQQENQVIGVLILGTIDRVRDFTNHEIELCHTISNQLSLGIQNARLHEGLLKYTNELETQITERKRAEEQIQKDLQEKEVMLKEIHHRVKNNLNVIISLLRLQANRIQNKEQASSAFVESCDRIFSMALIHEQLYKSDDFLRVDMKHYIQRISNNLKAAYASGKDIDLKLNIDDVFLDINNAIPCGLILNELLSNAYKHAFPDNRKGSIQIKFRHLTNGTHQLTIKDSGRGLPDTVNIQNTETLGLKLIHILTEQIDGKLEIKSDETGTGFDIRF